MTTGQSERRAVILMYHRIADDGWGLSVTPADFREHLALLRAEGYNVLSLPALARALQDDALPEKAIAITLDDGYLDSLTEAAPALQAFGFPATFFIVTGMLDRPVEFWWDGLERAFARADLPPLLDVGLPSGVTSMPTVTPAEREAAFDAVRCDFYALPLPERSERIAALLRWSGVAPVADADAVRAMTPAEVASLDRLPGMEIGCHSENHLLLPAQPTATKRDEIALGKTKLEALLGHPVASFCYPHGAFDDECAALARDAGYALAVTTGQRPATPGNDPLILPRCGVYAGDDLSARLETLFAAEPHESRRTHA